MHGRRALCARLVVLVSLVALASGCRTNAMKGTPFFTGEYKGRVGPAENRVNLWPLAYWRDPALSILWPLGEFADDRIAVRPFWSQYRQQGADSPYTEYNALLGLVSFDTFHHDNRVFPVFWGGTPEGRRYRHVFPLYWSASDESRGTLFNTLFPLWIYDRARKPGGDETDLWIAWPLYHRQRTPDASKDALFPIWSHSRGPAGARSDRFGLFLAGDVRDGGGHRHWIAPFYYRDEDGDTFLSLLYAQSGDRRCLPLLLSGWDRDRGRLLLGLGGWNADSSWFFPLWYQNQDAFLSLPYASGPRFRAVPPLLSAWGDGWGLLAGGLLGWNGDARWLAPLYYRNPGDGLFVSPLYAGGADWTALPPLLSAWGDDWGRILLGLGGWGKDAHWLAPLYYRDASHFLSLPYATVNNQTFLPLLLSGWDDRGDWGRLLLGLGGWEKDAHWLAPLYYRDPSDGTFLTPLFGRYHDHGRAATTNTYWATPLVGTRSGETEGSWFFPFWSTRRTGDAYDHNFLLLGGARRTDADRSAVWFHPLFYDRSDARVARFRAEMDEPRAPDRPFSHAREWGDGTTSHYYERDEKDEGTEILFGLAGSRHVVELSPLVWRLREEFQPPDAASPWARFLDPPSAGSTNAVARYLATDADWFWPLWGHETRRGVMFEIGPGAGGEKSLDASLETFDVLGFLYDWKRESIPEETHEYVRRRVLWRLYHYEKLDGDESTDIFPAITYDRRKDGYRKFSFLWRLFRYEDDPGKGTSLDILFLPICRP